MERFGLGTTSSTNESQGPRLRPAAGYLLHPTMISALYERKSPLDMPDLARNHGALLPMTFVPVAFGLTPRLL